jgi:hypothetical protein
LPRCPTFFGPVGHSVGIPVFSWYSLTSPPSSSHSTSPSR